ncbi:hypothetical protein SAMN06298216_2186 [Spirosomataceae bacterium TFI 002]|nr:hypothetical protein SAMN06298216_2186 [Spirosomataceae bacterium TFI 002]
MRIIILLLSVSLGISAQDSLKTQYISAISIGGGSAHYIGDLAPIKHFPISLNTNVKYNVVFDYSKFVIPYWSIGANASYTVIAGDDFTFASNNIEELWLNYLRNLNFTSLVFGAGVESRIYLTRLNGREPNRFDFFVSNGVKLIRRQSKTSLITEMGKEVKIRDLTQYNTAGASNRGNASNSVVHTVFPFGFGIQFHINKKIALGLNLDYNFVQSDLIDDVGNDPYPEPTELQRYFGPNSVLLSNRAAETRTISTFQSRSELLSNPVFIENGIYGLDNINSFVGYQGSLSDRRGQVGNDSYYTSRFYLVYKFQK